MLLQTAHEVIDYFMIEKTKAAKILKQIQEKAGNWLLWMIFAVSFVLLHKFNINSLVVILTGIALGYILF